MKNLSTKLLLTALLASSAGTLSSVVSAHEKLHAKAISTAAISSEEHAFGKQGDPTRVTRTIAIDMNDMMRFTPAEITVKQGETIRFEVKNSGKMLHEMVLGTMDKLKQHHEAMKKYPDMEHDEPYMLHVSPGNNGAMIWQFTQSGEFNYACLLPGHFEAGMIGKIKVVKGSL